MLPPWSVTSFDLKDEQKKSGKGHFPNPDDPPVVGYINEKTSFGVGRITASPVLELKTTVKSPLNF